ncbi:MAG: hypothetical protein EBS05_07955 [Proteobacteria bacterium]|nr:hypothetical protein [Pseudomonadota bacterium]
MNQTTRRSLGWLLFAAMLLLCLWSLRPFSQPPSTGPAAPIAASRAATKIATVPPPATDPWNGWRTQLPATKPAIEDVTTWPAQRGAPFEAFRTWQTRYAAAHPAGQAALEAEGVALATARRAAMAKWIERDPEFALAQAVGPDARRNLPETVLAELERWVEGRGALDVMVRCGPTVKASDQLVRNVRLEGERFTAFVYGRRLGQATKYDLPVHGVAVDGKLALHSSPVRQLEPGEVRERGLAANAIHLETGGEIALATSALDAFAIETRMLQREGGRGPYPTGQLPAGRPLAGLPPGTAAFPPSPGWTLGPKRTLIIRVDFSDDTGGPYDFQTGQTISAATINSVISTANQYYQANSQNQTSIAATILPAVLRMPQTKATYGNGSVDVLRADALAAATAYDQQNGASGQYDPSTYDLDSVVFSSINGTDWGFGGLATVGGKGMWVNAEFDLRIYAHETGHNYGLLHGNRWDVTGSNPIDPNGTHNEYGDEYDMMGANFADNPVHFNEWFKSYLGWLNATNRSTAPTGGVYRLFRHDHANASGLRAITVGQQSDRAYWLGYRHDLPNYQAASQSFLANGLEIRWGMQPPGITSDMDGNGSRLLNFTPATTNFTQHPLPVGQTFADPAFSLSITPVRIGGTSPNEFVDVNITYSIPIATITQPPQSLTVYAGSTATFTVGVSGTGPFSYQWVFNNSDIPGATSSNLTLTAVTTNQAGSYFVRVINPGGTAISLPATLTVTPINISGSGLLAHWKFDEPPGSTVAVDSMGNFNGTLSPTGAALVPGGRSGNAISLTKTANGYVNMGQVLDLTGISFTLVAWVRVAPTEIADTGIVHKHDSGTPFNGYYMGLNTSGGGLGQLNHAYFYTGAANAANPVSTTVVNDNNWHQIVTVFQSSGQSAIYVDGAPAESTSLSPPIVPNTANFLIGGYSPGGIPAGSLNGLIDDVQVYGRALSDPEIDYLFQNPGQEITGAPFVITPPQGTSVVLGGSATFDVAVNGNPPFTYQWRFNGNSIPGANGATLTLNNVQTNQAGNYSVRVDNTIGFAVSAPATLTVLVPPYIIANPTNRTVLAGSNVNFTVKAGGTQPLSYQWRFNGTNLPGATAASLLVPNAQIGSSGNYSVLVSNPYGSANSSNAVLVVNSAPVITTQPSSLVASVAAPVTFNVGVAGTPPFSYQWRFNGTPIAGATGPAYTIGGVVSAHGGFYSVRITNAFGSLLSSNTSLTVLPSRVFSPWSATAGGSGTDAGKAVAVDQAGNVFIGGYYSGTASFGTNTLTSNGAQDGFLAKYDSTGQLLWVRSLGGPGYDVVNALAVDTNGNCYVIGNYEGTAALGSLTLTNTSATSFSDVFIAKFDGNGTGVWARTLGVVAANDLGTALSLDGAGNVYIAGQSTLASFNRVALTNYGRIFLAKYDNAGNPLWARKAGAGTGGPADQATAVAADAAGNVYLAGVFSSATANFSGSLALTNVGGADGFLARYDSNGVVQWAQSIAGPQDDRPNGVAVDTAGNAYVVGEFTSALQLPGTNLTTGVGDQNIFLARFDATGATTWAQQAGGTLQDSARAVTVDASNRVFVAGYFSGATTFGADTLVSISNTFDAFVAQLDTNGTFAFAQQAGGGDLGGDYALAVAADTNGSPVIAGYFSGASSLGRLTATSAGAEDVFVAHFNAFAGATTPTLGFLPGSGRLRLSWPLGSSSYVLQTTTNLLSPTWTDVLGELGVETNDFAMTNGINGAKQFFRLRKP